jgi:oxygen-independent coproporphyrinogen III oxidase
MHSKLKLAGLINTTHWKRYFSVVGRQAISTRDNLVDSQKLSTAGSHILRKRKLLRNAIRMTSIEIAFTHSKALRVNRISLGVQSLNQEKLKRLERDHCETDVRRAIAAAKNLGFDVSIDMIFAAPQETLAQWQTDLDQAISLEPDHLSTYELTYEKGTQFWNRLNHGTISEAGEDLRAEMYSHAINRLRKVGMHQYEVSSFAQTDKVCRHNLAYWQGDPFFAFGPGAARFVDGIRETNHRSTTQYLNLVHSGKSPVADREHLPPEPAARERLAIGLRMIEGVDETQFYERTGYSVRTLLQDLERKFIDNDLLKYEDRNFRLTQRGIMLCDWIAAEIVNHSPSELGS